MDSDLFLASVVDGLKLPLSQEGFSWQGRDVGFVRRVKGCTRIFQMRILERRSALQVEPSVGMRFDEIENVFHRTSGFRREFQEITPAIGCSVFRISGEFDAKNFMVSGQGGLLGAVDLLTKVFAKVALPYFHRFSSLEAIEFELKSHPKRKAPHRIHEWLRSATGIIVAKRLGIKDFKTLAGQYRDKLSKYERGFYLGRFERLLEDLEKVEWVL